MQTSVALKQYPSEPYEVAAYSASRKSSNEDAYFVGSFKPSMKVTDVSPGVRWRGEVTGPNRGLLMIVADGMSGGPHGALASKIAIEEAAGFTLENVVSQKMPTRFDATYRKSESSSRITVPGLRDQLLDVVAASDQALRDGAQTHGALGSTLTLAYLLWPLLYVAHVGDSRAYVMKNGQLLQVTKDHSLGAQAAAVGYDNVANEWHHALWNVLGDAHRCAAPDLHKVTLEPHDRWLVTSNGFHNFVSPEEVLDLALRPQNAFSTCQSLVQRALDNGSNDDATVIFGRYIW